MNPRELVVAAVRRDDLTARQLVKDALRDGYSWSTAPAPDFSGKRCRAVYASLVELLAHRSGQQPPAWVTTVGAAPAPVFLMAKKRGTFMHGECERLSPAPLKKRNVMAMPDYLNVVA